MLDASVKVGVKRKLDEAALYDDSYHEERQAILNVSMYKLKSFSASRVEPSLLRSVLIYNTLKYIEHELNNEGLSVPNLATPPSLTIQNGDTLDPIPASADAQDGLQKLDIRSSPRPERCYHSIKPAPIIQPVQCDDVTMRYHGNTWSDPPSLTQLQPPSEKLPKLGAHVDFNSNSTPVSRRDYRNADYHSHQYQTIPVAPSLTKTDEDLFGDIDIDFALYDFDLLSPMSQKLPPISADELIHVIPQAAEGYNYNYNPYPTPSSGASCKTEVICDDLDHIMQVLVGM